MSIELAHRDVHTKGFLKRGLPAPPGSNPIDTSGWAIAYDLQPDRPFPERG